MNGRIAVLSASLRGGGAERAMVNLTRGFAERGLKVDLVLVQAEGPYLSQVPPHVNIVDLRATRVMWSLIPLVRYLRDNKPIALISAMGHVNMIALWARRVSGISTKIIVSVQVVSSCRAPKGRRAISRTMPYLVRRFYPWAEQVAAVSQCVADDLIHTVRLPSNNIAVIYNPVVVPELFEIAKDNVKHPWFEQSDQPVILSVGRLTQQKDYPTLIRAVAKLRRKCPARLVILGEGEDRPALEKLIKELGLENQVALPGFVDNPYAFMARAAVFVLSSKWEGLPTVLIEALALGTPVVSTECQCGPSEILANGRYGKLVPVGDPKALAAAIDASLTHSEDRYNGESWKDFTLESVVNRYISIIYSPHRA